MLDYIEKQSKMTNGLDAKDVSFRLKDPPNHVNNLKTYYSSVYVLPVKLFAIAFWA